MRERHVIYDIRRADLADVHQMAAAHLDSIRSLGAHYYDPQVVDDWGAQIRGELYADAMARGEAFFIAIGGVGSSADVLGFSSHRVDEGEHRTAVYVRGAAARCGVGSALFRAAESAAIAAGATCIQIDASLAAVQFYEANGFAQVGRGAHRLSTGRTMACVFMCKALRASGFRSSD